MRGYYGRQRAAILSGEPPSQGAAVPVIIMGSVLALLVAVIRDERKLGKR